MPRPLILLNCRNDELTRERLGFHSALTRVADVVVSPVARISEAEAVLADGRRLPATDLAGLWHLDPPMTLIPEGLPSSQIPTLIMHMDAASSVSWRSLWSRLFDVACLCSYDGKGYESAGTYRILHQSYAARQEWLDEPVGMRDIDVGWVGTTQGGIYGERRRLLPQLAFRYRMNDWRAPVPETEVMPVYRRSKVVVNIQRDDFADFYNVRCFEALAAGALLMARRTSTIVETGLRDGIHFVGYGSDDDLFAKVDFYLANESARATIAEAGREAVRRNHTYDDRVAQLLDVITNDSKHTKPQCRLLSAEERVHAYAHYYIKHGRPDLARDHFRALVSAAPRRGLALLPHYLRAVWRQKC